MTDLIRRLLAWASLLLMGPASTPRPRPSSAPSPYGPPRNLTPPLPPHRSPYTRDDTPLDVTAIRPVRPYLIAHEQRQHRRELAVATLGQHMPGPYVMHGLEVA
ncbi:hypothetical protein GCM10010383_52470 [Streptomyces lomondensis]|uniref:Secreted protein n=1 Tax=Streptomyces lomondensis TaxID=68229 RepID=A0ABQ2XID3_9ACTN|nr:hypothetical protein GCM10010383_52470 [Streptomyces lomondensis]